MCRQSVPQTGRLRARLPDEEYIWCNGGEGDLKPIEVPDPEPVSPRGTGAAPRGGLRPPGPRVPRPRLRRVRSPAGGKVHSRDALPPLPSRWARRPCDGAGGWSRRRGILGRHPGGPAILLLGLFLLRYPFATPQMIGCLGIEKSVRVSRVIAGAIAAGRSRVSSRTTVKSVTIRRRSSAGYGGLEFGMAESFPIRGTGRAGTKPGELHRIGERTVESIGSGVEQPGPVQSRRLT